jgi:dTDP-4-dehydrorhamnose 3,5-epimerase
MSQIIQGRTHIDERGKLIFFNEFDMSGVKRFYVIEHHSMTTVRAWQGHRKEEKWFYVISGSFKVALVQPDDWERPSQELLVEEYVLTASKPEVLHIPGGYANGFKGLEPGSKMMVFSSFTVAESKADDYRFDADKWYDWNTN